LCYELKQTPDQIGQLSLREAVFLYERIIGERMRADLNLRAASGAMTESAMNDAVRSYERYMDSIRDVDSDEVNVEEKMIEDTYQFAVKMTEKMFGKRPNEGLGIGS
jgi:hypothetical protein